MQNEIVEAKEEAAEAAQDQANKQEIVAEVVTEAAEEAIERAEEREAAADAVAVAVTEAAIRDEKHREVLELRERIEKCQTEMATMNTETMAKLSSMETAMAEMTARLPPLILPPSNPAPMLESESADALESPKVETEIIQEAPEPNPASPDSQPPSAVARRRRLRLL